MDDTDRRLVSLLRDNARLPVASLAVILGLSRATVQNRIDRLLRDGTITGFTIKLRPDAEPSAICAIMMIEIEGERTEPIIKVLRGLPEVAAIHTTNGRWDSDCRTQDHEPGCFRQGASAHPRDERHS